MPTIQRVEKIADAVTLNDTQTSFSCKAMNMSGSHPLATPIYYAIGSNQVSSGQASGVLNGALTEADLANSPGALLWIVHFFPPSVPMLRRGN